MGEQIGSVGTGVSVEFLGNHLKLRKFSSCINLEEAACQDQQINFCVICQVHILKPLCAPTSISSRISNDVKRLCRRNTRMGKKSEVWTVVMNTTESA